MISINARFAGGHTLDEFSKIIEKRQHYLNETAFQSIHAMAIEVLKSIRGFTKVAKASGIKVALSQRTDLQFSYYRVSAAQSGNVAAAKMCIRTKSGVRLENGSVGKFVFVDLKGVKTSDVKVFQFKDVDGDNRVYLICAVSQAAAKKAAQRIVASRLLRYAGLAKRAMSALMIKTNTRGPADSVNARVYAKAIEVTAKRDVLAKSSNGSGKYGLILEDNLRYAARALKGGQSAVDMALKKAANKSIGLIQHKCKNLLLPGELKTPFPEVVKKGAA